MIETKLLDKIKCVIFNRLCIKKFIRSISEPYLNRVIEK